MKIDPQLTPLPPKHEFNPLKGEIFLRGRFLKIFAPGLFIRPSYNPSWWEKFEHLGLGAPKGGSKGGHGGQKLKYGSKCLKLPNSSRKVVFSRSKIFHPKWKTLRKFSMAKFLSVFHFGWKFFDLEKTTFLDELGNFKHFEPYLFFWPPWPPFDPPLGGPKTKMFRIFSTWGVVTKSNKEPSSKIF